VIEPITSLPIATDRDREKFYGAWATEDDAAVDFDRRVAESGLFKSHPEVSGFYLASRVHRQPKSARIDRILFPTPKLREAGWTMPIGVELKRSGEHLGHAVAQAIDYTYAAFDVRGTYVHLEMIFLWPLQRQGGAIKSVMTQNGIGEAFEGRSDLLVFHAEHSLIRAKPDGDVEVRAHVAARKVGSR
jgi:hypothetical protein